ncbi:DUF4832 domain-containing protein [Rivularia sp. UHCC 0363]|uniref:DUF4832 domain-containing protein n=1 Tax=Rivularia sp. UHCC 0363 TaxID=3110244 RepID=UPI002B20CC46|nr:DUF4832 domain-containing protein [Rivularia sp. UHCC 0363]MEA5597656.1 DUF4832 domain-containing protein [Rivularia sp. UHCC 0363]
MRISFKKCVSSLSLIAITGMAYGCRIMPLNASTVQTTYSESFENFPNPERGFYIPFNPEPYQNKAFTPLQLSELRKLRNDNLSLVRRIYLIPDRSAQLPESFLNLVSQDLQTAREAGLKLIIRFTYNWQGGGPDASKNEILTHMEQLKPILQDNYDAIAYLHAGFIGYWGEWNRSTNDLLNTTDKKDILFKLLSVLPSERMVALRYPYDKTRIYDNENPLTSSEAFNNSNRARTGSHNDCFLASIDNWGTYKDTNESIIEEQKSFLNQDNQYLVQGGETCNSDSQAQPYIGCDNALKELERMRWSAINYSYDEGVLDTWRNEGCMEEIKRRLGYRFRLVNSQIPDSLKPGGKFVANFEVENLGWASPYNPRLLEVILRNRETNQEYFLRVNEDPRRWLPGSSNTVNIEAGLPENLTTGEYDLFLNLPDPTPKLYNRPEYSIRLANVDVWEESTGYNSLLRSIVVNAGAGGSTYSGSDYFQSR